MFSLQQSFEGDESIPHVTTIPFLLQLASMSPMLLHIVATDIVNACKFNSNTYILSAFAEKNNKKTYSYLLGCKLL